MPEGDVLRRTAARLDLALAGQRVLRTDLRWPTAATVDLSGATVLGTRPYGKHLLTRVDDGRTLHTHLRMDGSWRVVRTGSPEAQARSPRVRAVLGTGTWTALGLLLGMLDVVPTAREDELVGHLGPDVLDDDFLPDPEPPTPALPPERRPRLGIDAAERSRWTGPGLDEAVRRWREQGSRPAAEVLLDQRVAAGLGTVYMAESLFARRVWPWTPADEIDDPAALYRVARAQMRRSVVTGDGPGRMHARAGLPCPRCGRPVQEGSAGAAPTSRAVFWCARCQADPAGRATPPVTHQWARASTRAARGRDAAGPR